MQWHPTSEVMEADKRDVGGNDAAQEALRAAQAAEAEARESLVHERAARVAAHDSLAAAHEALAASNYEICCLRDEERRLMGLASETAMRAKRAERGGGGLPKGVSSPGEDLDETQQQLEPAGSDLHLPQARSKLEDCAQPARACQVAAAHVATCSSDGTVGRALVSPSADEAVKGDELGILLQTCQVEIAELRDQVILLASG